MNSLVFLTKKGNKATDSLLVAIKFEKRHDHVIRDIRTLIADYANLPKLGDNDNPPVDQLFLLVSYKDSRQREQQKYLISEMGFKLLAMRMSGPRAFVFQTEFILAFDKLHARVEQLEAQLQPQQAADEVARLVKYTNPLVQIECVKGVAGALVGKAPQGFGIINHHRAVMKLLTGERPSEYVTHALQSGLKVRGKSGRAVLRIQEPHKAATAAVLDDAVRAGKTLDNIKASGVAEALPQAFAAIIQLGLKPADLAADRAA